MGRALGGMNFACLSISFLVLVTFKIQFSSGASSCWDCDKTDSRGRSDNVQSTVEQPKGTAHDNVVSSNLDCLFRDPPQDELVPAKKDNTSDNNNNNSSSKQQNTLDSNQTSNHQTSSFNHGEETQLTPQPPSRWSGIDTLIAIFFAMAATWLIAATFYSITLLLLIRLQARGELDIYDEDLGRFTFCNGRFSLHLGCILRRYAIQLERDYQRRLRQRFGELNGEEEQPPEPGPIRIMTREERRHAVEQLLGIQPSKLEHVGVGAYFTTTVDEKNKRVAGPASPAISLRSSQEGPVCSICLDGYEPTDIVFKSTSCAHMFHKDCLMEWLERRNNTVSECC
jgi:hypothetical protein